MSASTASLKLKYLRPTPILLESDDDGYDATVEVVKKNKGKKNKKVEEGRTNQTRDLTC